MIDRAGRLPATRTGSGIEPRRGKNTVKSAQETIAPISCAERQGRPVKQAAFIVSGRRTLFATSPECAVMSHVRLSVDSARAALGTHVRRGTRQPNERGSCVEPRA